MSKTKEYALKKNYKIDKKMTLEIERKLRLSRKIPVTIRIPEDVIESFKKKAGKEGKYQQIMREILIEAAKR